MKSSTDDIFRALSDPNRRRILDIAKNRPGITVNELTDEFDFSRYAVMKHLKILESCNLIISKKEGKFRKLYLNAIPIQTIYDRWISKFSKYWAQNITALKYKLEEDSKMSQPELKHVFVIYIKTTKEKLWEALTHGDVTHKYFFATKIKSDFSPGSKLEFHGVNKEGEPYIPVSGEVIEVIPQKKLVYSFQQYSNNDKPSRVTYEIEEVDGNIKFTVTHDQFDEVNETYNSVQQGWPYILSGLKTYLETNKTLS